MYHLKYIVSVGVTKSYRPGPLDAKVDKNTTFAERYVENGSIDPHEYMKKVHPDLRDIYARTRGVMVYQEQIMSVCQKIAGYSLGDADIFRRVVGKKKINEVKAMRYQFLYGGEGGIQLAQEKLDEAKAAQEEDAEGVAAWDQEQLQFPEADRQKHALVKAVEAAEDTLKVLKKNKTKAKGALNNGYTEEDLDFLNQLYDQMSAFAAYAFNRSHSDVYADLGYVTAWDKTYYPAHFMAAVLTMEDDSKKMDDHYAECKRLGIKILPPDINTSKEGFTVEKQADGTHAVRMGLVAIKSIGSKVAEEVIAKRPFTDIVDFGTRIDKRTVNRASADRLIQAGAFDTLEPDRFKTLNTYHLKILQDSITSKNPFQPYKEGHFTEKDALAWEKEHLGLYVSSHPFDQLPYQPLSTVRDREVVDIGGQVVKIKKIKTKRGDEMAFVEVQTQSEKMDVTFFPNVWEEYKDRVVKEALMIFRVKKEVKDKTNWMAEKVLIPKKAQLGNATQVELEKKPKSPKEKKKKQMTLDDLGGVDVKDDPLLELFG